MKTLQFLSLLGAFFLLSSCSNVRVASDYDQNVNFNEYQTYAFYKPGIDKATISDLDKKRILRAIDAEMSAKGFTKSENPTMLISIFTKANERVNVYQNNFGFGGFGYRGNGGLGYWGNNTSTYTEGTLYIDIIDNTNKQLIWQGQGSAPLTNRSVEKREERIQEIVNEIMQVYPPEITKK